MMGKESKTLQQRLEKAVREQTALLTKIAKPAVSKSTGGGAAAADVADALTILADPAALDGRPDRDTVLTKAAATITRSPLADSALVTNLTGDAAETLDKARHMAALTAPERISTRQVLSGLADGSRGYEAVEARARLDEHDRLAAEIPPAPPTLDQVLARGSAVRNGVTRR